MTGKLPGGACIPPLLEGWKYKILLAGKYVNVMRECGVDIDNSPLHGASDEEWQVDSERSANDHASWLLLITNASYVKVL